MELHLKIVGILLMILALAHAFFPRYFKWKQEFQDVSLMNKQMMYVHSFYVAFTVFLIGLLCVACTTELLTTRLGNYIVLGICIFWSLRLLFQFFVFSPQLWRGKRFETIMHIAFSLLWCYLSTFFFLVWYKNNP